MAVDNEMEFVIADNCAAGVEGYFTPAASSDYFRGHFPGQPIVPGVLLVEVSLRMLAKALEVSRAKLNVQALKKISFLRPVYPNECVKIILNIGTAQTGVTGLVDGETAFRFSACVKIIE